MSMQILYLITVLIWGSTWLAIKFQLGNVPPELSIAYRFALASIILLIYCRVKRLPLRFKRDEHLFMALQGLLLFSLNYILVYLSEGYLTSGLVAIVFSMIVVTNVLFGAIFLGNPVRGRVLAGAGVGFLGLTLVFWPELSTFNLSSDRALGIGLALVATLSASLGNIVSARNQRAGLPVVQTNAIGMSYGTVFMVILSLARGIPLTFDPAFSYIISLLYLAVFGSVIAFGSYLTLLGNIGPDRAAYVTVLFPVVALILSTLYEDLTWTFQMSSGVSLVILGNLIAQGGYRLKVKAAEE